MQIGAVAVRPELQAYRRSAMKTVIALVLTLAILYLSEIIPKTLGAKFWMKLAPASCFVITWLVKLVFYRA